MRLTSVLLVTLLFVSALHAKLSTKEKFAISAGAAGLALGASYLVDALEDLEATFSSSFSRPSTYDVVDEIKYRLRKMKNTYAYELDCARDYEKVSSWRLQARLEDELIDHITAHELISQYKRHLNHTIDHLAAMKHKLEVHIDDLYYSNRHSHLLHLCRDTLHEIQQLIQHFNTLIEMIDHAHYAYRALPRH